MHVELLLEEESAAIAVDTLLKRMLNDMSTSTWRIQYFRGKQDMFRKLPPTLRSLARANYADWTIVMLDSDRDDCVQLKRSVIELAEAAGLIHPDQPTSHSRVRVRIATTELESWFLGDPEAICSAFARVSRRDLRLNADVDSLQDAWERLERTLIQRRYYAERMRKKEVARLISEHLNLSADHNTSRSFRLFLRTLREVYGLPTESPSSRSPSR